MTQRIGWLQELQAECACEIAELSMAGGADVKKHQSASRCGAWKDDFA
jgi:hypothetical protein